MTEATASGKVILFGEHAVVYGRPAIAAPVTQVRATAWVEDSESAGVRLVAADLGAAVWLADAPEDDPLALAARLVQQAAGMEKLPDLTITVHSTIPIASGMGSGAATAAAVIRALARRLGLAQAEDNAWVSGLTYQVEKIHHGTPSGIDNTVVTRERPVYFIRRQPHNYIETLTVGAPLRLLVADTGIRSSTREVVGDVRRQWQAEPERFELLFDRCGGITKAAREAIERGAPGELGALMRANHLALKEMTVSSPELNWLVEVATRAGALGAKMSGAGRGGNMIALIEEETEEEVRAALLAAGATAVITSFIT